jgi:hypothetical protein
LRVRGTHILICEKRKRVLGQEKKREQLRQRGRVLGQIWAASRGHTWAVLCSKGRPNSGHIQQPSEGAEKGPRAKKKFFGAGAEKAGRVCWVVFAEGVRKLAEEISVRNF